MNWRIIYGCGLLYLSSISSFAQVTIAEFLKSASDDFEVKSFSEQLNYLQKKPYRLSLLQKLEFRTQNRELNKMQQEYGLRFNPANPWEVRNNNLYFKDYQTLIALEKEMEFKEALTDRYYRVIDYLFLTEIRDLNTTNYELLNSQLSVLEKQLGSSFFDADEYVKLRVESVEKSVDLEETGVDINNLTHEVEGIYPNSFKKQLVWDYKNIIPISRIQNVVDSLATVSAASTLLNYQQQKITLARREYQLEKANINPGFLQTEYDRRRVHQDRTPVNISLGVTIPITNPNKGDMAKRQLEVIEAKYDLEESKQEAKLDLLILQEKLSQLITQRNNLQNKISDLEKSDLANTLHKLKGDDPLIVIQFNSSIVKLKSLLVKLKRNILMTYIDYLAFTDNLQQQPLVNFLSYPIEGLR